MLSFVITNTTNGEIINKKKMEGCNILTLEKELYRKKRKEFEKKRKEKNSKRKEKKRKEKKRIRKEKKRREKKRKEKKRKRNSNITFDHLLKLNLFFL